VGRSGPRITKQTSVKELQILHRKFQNLYNEINLQSLPLYKITCWYDAEKPTSQYSNFSEV